MIRLSKYLIYTGISIFLLAAVVVGAYYYTLNQYAGQIDNLMDIFLDEMLEDELLHDQEPESKEDISPKPAAEDADEREPQESIPVQDEKSNEPGPAPPTLFNEKEGLQELEEKFTPAFKNLELKDQLFTLQMLRKFSIDELQEMYRLYQAGGEAWGKLLSKMEQKITPESMERIKQVAMKYRGLL